MPALVLSMRLQVEPQMSPAGRAAFILGGVLCVPFVLVVVAGVLLQRMSAVAPPVGWLIVSGPMLAVIVNLVVLVQLAVTRRADARELEVRLSGSLAQLTVLLAAFVLAGGFAAHLVADEVACLNGVTRAC